MTSLSKAFEFLFGLVVRGVARTRTLDCSRDAGVLTPDVPGAGEPADGGNGERVSEPGSSMLSEGSHTATGNGANGHFALTLRSGRFTMSSVWLHSERF